MFKHKVKSSMFIHFYTRLNDSIDIGTVNDVIECIQVKLVITFISFFAGFYIIVCIFGISSINNMGAITSKDLVSIEIFCSGICSCEIRKQLLESFMLDVGALLIKGRGSR